MEVTHKLPVLHVVVDTNIPTFLHSLIPGKKDWDYFFIYYLYIM